MPDAVPDTVMQNLIEALNRLHDDLDRVELWTAALKCFQESPPEYRPRTDYVLPRHDDKLAS
jgi:redox-sensitive bicupin YhaK (pirin superfamily)